jgi:two-component system chemotaxis sensor kinase CheA
MADDLARSLREAFLADLAEHVVRMEEGLLALERSDVAGERAERLRELFRSAHGLKGAARAAGLAACEATCHAMESLLGEARDAGRVLDRPDFEALLGAVDALAGVERALQQDPAGALDEAALAAARAAVDERLARSPGRPPPGSQPAGAREVAPTRERPRGVRVTPERLDALAASGFAILRAARRAEQQASRADALAQELRRARRDLRAARERGGGAGAGTGRRAGPADRLRSAEDRLGRVERDVLALRAELAQDGRALSAGTRRLDADVRSLRLVPWGEATAGLDRVARDLAGRLGKHVGVEVEGADLELDQSVVAALREPLAQLVHNAVDHGIEPPEERTARGKPSRGRVTLSASVRGERVHVRVSDDGHGLDPAELREAARRRGLPVPADDARALELVFLPGFSTAGSITAISGRGVGLDVVAGAVRALRGTLRVSSRKGEGSSFELALPATLYGLRALLVRAGDTALALPSSDVARVVRVPGERVQEVDGRPALLIEPPVAVAPLAHLLGLAAGSWAVRERHLAVILATADGDPGAAVLVDEVLSERDLALEPLGGAVQGVRFVAGVALLEHRELALVLRAEELAAAVHGGVAAPAARRPAPRPRPRILLADDAATTRTLERSLLEAAGYDVLAAADGEQALALLQERGADLVLTDVEMPRRDGIELTRAVRSSPRFGALPVVLLTGRQSEDDRRRGLEAGADAYLVKSSFDQRQLLATVAQLLQGGDDDPRADR